MFLCGDDGLGRCCRAEAIADQQFDPRDGILHALCPCGEHDDAEAFIAGHIPAASPVGCHYSAKARDLGIILGLPGDCVLSLNAFNL
jgi:hypothetical protein